MVAVNGNTDLAVKILIGEASLLHIEAQVALNYIYHNGIKDFARYDSRILAF